MLGFTVFVMNSSLITNNDSLVLGVTIDLLLTIPLVYFLLIRKTQIPKTTVVPVMILGMLIGSYFLPKDSQSYLELFKTWFLPVIEISILTFLVIKVRKTIKKYKYLKGNSSDFFLVLKNACSEILPQKLIIPFATEIAVIYYGFINWKSKVIRDNEYTYHKKNGSSALFGALIMVIIIESIAVHLLLAKWSEFAAWVLTILSVYTAIQVLGFAKSISQRPITINESSLMLKYGIMNEVEIAATDIISIEVSSSVLEKDTLTKSLSPLGGVEGHNVRIQLKRECDLIGLYGFKKRFKVIGLYVDERDRFVEQVELMMKNSTLPMTEVIK